MIRHLFIASTFALSAGCASLSPPPPLLIPGDISDSAFRDALQRLQAQQRIYQTWSDRLAGDAMWINGVSVVASVATLGFAAYKSPKDNVLAAALTTGVANAANTQLNPTSASAFYSAGATTLSCVYNSARVVRSHGGLIEGDDPFKSPSEALLTYQALRQLLTTLREQAEALSKTTTTASSKAVDNIAKLKKGDDPQAAIDALKEAMEKSSQLTGSKLTDAITAAKAADSKLQLGINAQTGLLPAINKAMEDTHALVTKRNVPTLKSLIDAITKVEIPKPANAAPAATGSATGAKAMDLTARFGLNAVANDTPDELAAKIQKLADAVDDLHPQSDDADLKQIAACVVTFGASGSPPAK